MITLIEAHNYCCFPKLAIDLDRYQALAGANGAGKSTLLDVPVLIGDVLRRRSPHLVDVLCRPKDYRQILQRAGFWPEGVAKPPIPKEALDHGDGGTRSPCSRRLRKARPRNAKPPPSTSSATSCASGFRSSDETR